MQRRSFWSSRGHSGLLFLRFELLRLEAFLLDDGVMEVALFAFVRLARRATNNDAVCRGA